MSKYQLKAQFRTYVNFAMYGLLAGLMVIRFLLWRRIEKKMRTQGRKPSLLLTAANHQVATAQLAVRLNRPIPTLATTQGRAYEVNR